MVRNTRSSPGGIAARAIAGIECALVEIKARSLGISVAQLLGGPTRDRIRLYWSHCGTTRVRHPDIVGKPPIKSWSDVTALAKEVVARGFTALKTNIVMPGKGATWASGFDGSMGPNDEWVPNSLIAHIEKHIGTIRDAVGPDFDINLDLNFHFKPEACMRIAKALEPYNLHWLEIDNPDPDAIRQIKDSTSTKICTGETLIHMKEYLPFFQRHAADVYMLDVPWNGIAQGKKVGDLAATYQHNVAPHNHYSHLSTFMSANLCRVAVQRAHHGDRHRRRAVEGRSRVEAARDRRGLHEDPRGPGWGMTVNEEAVRAHPWKPGHATHVPERGDDGITAGHTGGEKTMKRRDFVLGTLARRVWRHRQRRAAKASQPATPVNFAVPPGACDCHTHIHGDPAAVSDFAGRTYTPEPALPEEMARLAQGAAHAARSDRDSQHLRHRQHLHALRHEGARGERARRRGDRCKDHRERAGRDGPAGCARHPAESRDRRVSAIRPWGASAFRRRSSA